MLFTQEACIQVLMNEDPLEQSGTPIFLYSYTTSLKTSPWFLLRLRWLLPTVSVLSQCY